MRNKPLTTAVRLSPGVSLRVSLLVGIVLFCCASCQQKMADQPSFRPLEPSAFFDNNQSARPLVPGTVSRGNLRLDPAYYTGVRGGYADRDVRLSVARTDLQEKPYVEEFPMEVTPLVMARGRERYNIYCSVCHGPLGYGGGVVVRRGFTAPPSYHTDRLRTAPVGYFFDVITRGFGSMPDYATPLPPSDRWAVVAYLRALQLSQHATLDELPAGAREEVRERVEGNRD